MNFEFISYVLSFCLIELDKVSDIIEFINTLASVNLNYLKIELLCGELFIIYKH